MGVLYDYFAAPSDADAAAVLDLVGGPSDNTASGILAIPSGIDPMVQLGQLESLLIRGNTDLDLERKRLGKVIAHGDDGAVTVVTIPDELQQTLAQASQDRIDEVAESWSGIEEFGGTADPTDLAQFLDKLADMARAANRTGQHLYCWICL